MRPAITIARPVLALLACAALGACVSVFPKTDPAQLYRFGALAPAEAPEQAAPSELIIAKGPIRFDSAANTDRILTVSGQGAAYIQAARWVAPAPVLFDQALERAFQAAPGAPRLVPRGVSRAPVQLNLEVQAFEARYDQGEEAPPQVVVSIRAALIRNADRQLVGERQFVSARRAAENRQTAIVAAYDQAVQEVLGQLTAWSGEAGAAVVASGPPSAS